MPPGKGGGARQRALRSTADRSRSRATSACSSPEPTEAASSSHGPLRGGARQRTLRSVPDESIVHQEAQDFRAYVAKLFLTNRFSSRETVELVTKARAAQAMGVDDLVTSQEHHQNASRDLLRRLLRNVTMPDLYWAKAPVADPDTGVTFETSLPVILPHELLPIIVQNYAREDLWELHPGARRVHAEVCAKVGLNPLDVLPLGLHGDGVPHQKGKSIEVLSWNFLSKNVHTRFLFALVDKTYTCKCGCSGRHTIERLLEVFSWSLRNLVAGAYPSRRHDGTEWQDTDKNRAKLRGTLQKAILEQVRGDWSWYKQIFSFPSWSGEYICWKCCANKSDAPYWDVSTTAQWRSMRLPPTQFWNLLQRQGLTPSSIFALPGMSLSYVAIDALHALDLGVSQHALGNTMWELANSSSFAGGTQAERVKALWAKLKKALPRTPDAKSDPSAHGGDAEDAREGAQDAQQRSRVQGAHCLRSGVRHRLAPPLRDRAQSHCEAVHGQPHGLLRTAVLERLECRGRSPIQPNILHALCCFAL